MYDQSEEVTQVNNNNFFEKKKKINSCDEVR